MSRLVIYACLGLLLGSFALTFALQIRRLLLGARPQTVTSRPAGYRRVIQDGLLQRGVRRKMGAGRAHLVIFYGFVLLLPRWVTLIGRAIEPGFGLASEAKWIVAAALGYQALKNLVILAVLVAVGHFGYWRLRRRPARFTPRPQALAILVAIAVMVTADLTYDAVGLVLSARAPAIAEGSLLGVSRLSSACPGHWCDPIASLIGLVLGSASDSALLQLGVAAYWLHVLTGACFLAALPHTKHWHLLAAWPNLYFDNPEQAGRVAPIAPDAQALLDKVESALGDAASEQASRSVLGKATLADFSIKERLEWFACSACGRCTEHCPAAAAGEPLDPMQLTQALRRHLESMPATVERAQAHLRVPVVPSIIDPKALWACTACGACEAQCPLAVRPLAPILEMRRELLLLRGEAPPALQRPFNSLERQFNPYQAPREQRAKWSEALSVPLLADAGAVEVLYWVGCAASYDERAQSVARAMVQLMRRANVTFAILGPEERCTGDAARRAGNELLFLELAEHNIRTLSRYRDEKRFERIVTACPHCLTTLSRDYAELGATFHVSAHVEAIEQWVRSGRLILHELGATSVTYHDPCTLARHAGVTAAPRRLLDGAPGVSLVEPERHGRHTHCCGGGGARYWLESSGASSELPSRQAQGTQCPSLALGEVGARSATDGGSSLRPSVQRARQLAMTGARDVLTACPFCLTMLEDAFSSSGVERRSSLSDVAEFVELHSRPKEA
jgi:Fe-S oxidoreductase